MIQEIIGDLLETVLLKQLIDEEFGEGEEIPKVRWKPIWEAPVTEKAKFITGLVQAGIITVSEARTQLGFPPQPQDGVLPAQPSPVEGKTPINAQLGSNVAVMRKDGKEYRVERLKSGTSAS